MAASWGRIYGRLIEIRVAEVDAKEREHYEITFRREEIRRGPRTPLFKVIGYEGYSPCKSMYPFKLESLQIGGMYLVDARAPFESLNLPPEWRARNSTLFPLMPGFIGTPMRSLHNESLERGIFFHRQARMTHGEYYWENR